MKITTSLAAILTEQNQPLVVDTIEMPKELDFGQVLVELHVSGICGSQIGEIKGVKGDDKYLPHLMGHEGCATVLEVGNGVTHLKPGNLVVLHWRKGLGIQSNPPKYKWKGKTLNAGWVTTFNKYAVVSENRCTLIPNDTNHQLAALFGCAITTGFGVIENNAKLRMGESIIVFGAGGIGLNIIQAASLVNAWPIIAVDLFTNRLELSKEFGATHIINSKEVNVENEIKNIIGESSGVNVFIDNTGAKSIIELGYKLIDKDGRLVLVGVPKIGENINIFTLPLHFGKTIVGSFGGDCRPHLDIPRYLKLFKEKKLLGYEKIVSSLYPLHQINKALDSMQQGNTAGRVLIKL